MSVMIFLLYYQTPLCLMAADHSSACSDEIAVNCGSTTTSKALEGRQWIGDAPSKLTCSPQLRGSSVSSTFMGKSGNVDQIPYTTVRISRSKFSYLFQVNSGQKCIRLYFNSAPYKGFKNYRDSFTVEAGPFTLLGNFSASLTANALGLKHFVKEFCIHVEKNQTLKLKLSPTSSKSDDTYAFINGIEIIPTPSGLYYTHDGDLGAQVIGRKSRVFIDSSHGLEMVERTNIRRSFISRSDDPSVFRRWASSSSMKPNTKNNFSWKISVDVGFGYLVRLHFCELILKMSGSGGIEFTVHINGKIAAVSVQGRSPDDIPWYRDYVVMMKGNKLEGKRDLVISLQFNGGELSNGPLKGFEIFKMSNPDNSLASPNPWPVSQGSPSGSPQNLILLLVFGEGNRFPAITNFMIVLVGIVFYKLREKREANSDDETTRSAEGICRHFSLAEMKSATRNFSDGLVIGRGGFGKVYKGFIKRDQHYVAIKRLKANSKQGAHKFWTEIETLSKLRHVHLVSLLGYCNENQEMILVYEYMPCGTLADALYKLCGTSESYSPLSWEQRLRICVGAARGLEYVHTGTDNRIIHRDVKSSNILLDEDFVAKVSDFGLAKVGKMKQLRNHFSTNVKGTFGYLDPDYFLTRKLTTKSDVYAFGVVLLEVLSGRHVADCRVSENQVGLIVWAREHISSGGIDQIVDPNLKGQISPDSLKLFVEISQKCLQSDPKKRPTMAQLVAQLEFARDPQDNTKSLIPNQIMGEISQSIDPSQHTTSTGEQSVLECPEGNNNNSVQNCTNSTKKPSRLWPWKTFWTRVKVLKSPKYPDVHCHGFSMVDILVATNNFDDDLIIRRDELCVSYEGIDSSSRKIFVERVKYVREDMLYEINREIGKLSQLNHPNIASVLGYCYHVGEMIIVYDYVGKGSLCDYLYRKRDETLSLKHWLQICIGAARGLKYLHTETAEAIIHGDIRPANILLDDNMVAKLVNFGFCYFGPGSYLERITTTLIGEHYAYLPPDFFYILKLTEQADVYSFGLILLEVVCGTRTRDHNQDMDCFNGSYLPQRVRESIKRKRLLELIEPSVRENIAVECLSKFLKVSLSCLLYESKGRPSMDEVLAGLELALVAQEMAESTSENDVWT